MLNVANKLLPFKKQLYKVNLRQRSYSERYSLIEQTLSKYQSKYKVFVIDDSQYLMAFEMFERAKETGYGKFTDIAQGFKQLLDFIQTSTDDDVIVFLLHHIDTTDDGRIKAKTSGKMIDSQLTLEGLFSMVLMAKNYDGNYKFITQTDGFNPAKTPLEMFAEREIDNDLKHVTEVVREYYGLQIDQKKEG